MAKAEKGWVLFTGDIAALAAQICHVYHSGEGWCRVCLMGGRDFYVNEPYEDVMKAILEARSE